MDLVWSTEFFQFLEFLYECYFGINFLHDGRKSVTSEAFKRKSACCARNFMRVEQREVRIMSRASAFCTRAIV